MTSETILIKKWTNEGTNLINVLFNLTFLDLKSYLKTKGENKNF
jgi:hypothetical protein